MTEYKYFFVCREPICKDNKEKIEIPDKIYWWMQQHCIRFNLIREPADNPPRKVISSWNRKGD